jgi:hypothetical protein
MATDKIKKLFLMGFLLYSLIQQSSFLAFRGVNRVHAGLAAFSAAFKPRIRPANAPPPHLAKTSAGVLNPEHVIGVALILLITLSGFFCVVKRQLCFL